MATRRESNPTNATDPDYVVPLTHGRVPAFVGDGAFWALVGIALAEVVDPPLALVMAGALFVARSRRRR